MGAGGREDERSCVKGTGGRSRASTRTHTERNEYQVLIELYGPGPDRANEALGLSEIHSDIHFVCCITGGKQYSTFKLNRFAINTLQNHTCWTFNPGLLQLVLAFVLFIISFESQLTTLINYSILIFRIKYLYIDTDMIHFLFC